MPKVSILVPTYNQENYLRKALNSLVNQPLSNYYPFCSNNKNKIKQYHSKKNKNSKAHNSKIIFLEFKNQEMESLCYFRY